MILAFALIAMIGGAAALIQLSTMLEANFTLNSNLPLELEWAVQDPSSDWITLGSAMGQYVNFTNISPKTLANLVATITLTCPVGMTSLLCNIQFGPKASPGGVLVWSGVDNVFTATKALPEIAPNGEGQYTWSMTLFAAGALDGDYTMSLYISGDLA